MESKELEREPKERTRASPKDPALAQDLVSVVEALTIPTTTARIGFRPFQATPSGSPMNGGKSKGKMYTKGKCKKGKSKHKVAYNFDYFVDVSQYEDISNENYLEKSIYVMSLHDDRTVSTQGVHMVIVDTGATELVCGANAMARIYESADLRVSLADRPTFRFGNGLSQRATSRVDLTTNALGRLSFYIWTARWRTHLLFLVDER